MPFIVFQKRELDHSAEPKACTGIRRSFVISWCVLFIVYLGACAFLSSWNHFFFLNVKIQLLMYSDDDDDKTWAKSLKFATDLVILFADFHSIRSLAEFILRKLFFFLYGLTSSFLHLQVHCCKQYSQFLYVYFKSKWVCLYKIKNNLKKCSSEKACREQKENLKVFVTSRFYFEAKIQTLIIFFF